MGNADMAGYVFRGSRLFQIADLTLRLINVHLMIAGKKSNACRVITTIFQTMQTFYQIG